MDCFVAGVVKYATYLLIASGVGAVALGTVIYFWPKFIVQMAAVGFVLGGMYLIVGTAYALIKAKTP